MGLQCLSLVHACTAGTHARKLASLVFDWGSVYECVFVGWVCARALYACVPPLSQCVCWAFRLSLRASRLRSACTAVSCMSADMTIHVTTNTLCNALVGPHRAPLLRYTSARHLVPGRPVTHVSSRWSLIQWSYMTCCWSHDLMSAHCCVHAVSFCVCGIRLCPPWWLCVAHSPWQHSTTGDALHSIHVISFVCALCVLYQRVCMRYPV